MFHCYVCCVMLTMGVLSTHDLRHLPAGSRAVFEIYKRINSGGENLNDQQARKAAFW